MTLYYLLFRKEIELLFLIQFVFFYHEILSRTVGVDFEHINFVTVSTNGQVSNSYTLLLFCSFYSLCKPVLVLVSSFTKLLFFIPFSLFFLCFYHFFLLKVVFKNLFLHRGKADKIIIFEVKSDDLSFVMQIPNNYVAGALTENYKGHGHVHF